MNSTFTIDAENNITAYAGAEEASQGEAAGRDLNGKCQTDRPELPHCLPPPFHHLVPAGAVLVAFADDGDWFFLRGASR